MGDRRHRDSTCTLYDMFAKWFLAGVTSRYGSLFLIRQLRALPVYRDIGVP